MVLLVPWYPWPGPKIEDWSPTSSRKSWILVFISKGNVRWETFIEEICKRFEESDNSKINLIGELKNIGQTGTVDEYIEKFEELKT